jgi:hypothetical protein
MQQEEILQGAAIFSRSWQQPFSPARAMDDGYPN